MILLELIIVGGSAAGVTAAIYARRRGLNFKLISKDIGGEVATSGEIENWLGINKTTGLELSQSFLEQLKYNKIPFELEREAIDIKKENNFFEITVKKEEEIYVERARALIIATGSRPRKLNIPGEDKFYKRGVSYCTVCDGPVFKDKEVAIIGGGNSALEAGLMMAELSPRVYILNKNPQFKGDAILVKNLEAKSNVITIYNALSLEILGDKTVEALKYRDITTNEIKQLQISGIFVHIGMLSNSEFARIVEKNEAGEIKIDRFCATSVPGIFAAGDVTDFPYRQISIAAGQGAVAALSCVNYLNKI